MKLITVIKNSWLQFAAMLVLSFISVQTFAQDKKVDISINSDKSSNSTTWYAQPWVWVVGGAVFILLFVALVRGGRKD